MVDECTHEGHCCLLAPRWHPCEPQGPVILQALRPGVEGVPRPVFRDVMWSRWRAVSESSAMKGATYCVAPPRIARMTSCTTFGGARVLRHQ